jgi:putative two-component system response regulator
MVPIRSADPLGALGNYWARHESTSDVLTLAGEIALSHHECWDGSGYPVGLKGDEIPLSGRIVALADVFDALTHTRPYKPAWPVDGACDEIRRLSGLRFDPAVVGAFDSSARGSSWRLLFFLNFSPI